MVMPYAHLDRLAALPTEAAHELIDLAQRTERALERVYTPHGFNFGLNVGKAGGAGVAGHLHLHAMPRWAGDTNFMTTVGETRVLPEDLETTWKRMREALCRRAGVTQGRVRHNVTILLRRSPQFHSSIIPMPSNDGEGRL